jgi:hypothetical protein
MKGWVYVISNKAMPGVVKVGYSSKDPELRAAEFNSTASPHPHLVEYEVLVDDPYKLEQQAHSRLSDKREGKEWFRTSAEDATYAIRSIAGDGIISEDFKRAKREEVLRRQRKREDREAKEAADLRKEREARETKERKSKISEAMIASKDKLEELQYDIAVTKIADGGIFKDFWDIFKECLVVLLFPILIIIYLFNRDIFKSKDEIIENKFFDDPECGVIIERGMRSLRKSVSNSSNWERTLDVEFGKTSRQVRDDLKALFKRHNDNYR